MYNDILTYESATPVLRPIHLVLLSLALLLLVIIIIFVVYYNAFLAYKGRPPFRVLDFWPHILFPRGVYGLGQYNFEEETMTEQEILRQQVLA